MEVVHQHAVHHVSTSELQKRWNIQKCPRNLVIESFVLEMLVLSFTHPIRLSASAQHAAAFFTERLFPDWANSARVCSFCSCCYLARKCWFGAAALHVRVRHVRTESVERTERGQKQIQTDKWIFWSSFTSVTRVSSESDGRLKDGSSNATFTAPADLLSFSISCSSTYSCFISLLHTLL